MINCTEKFIQLLIARAVYSDAIKFRTIKHSPPMSHIQRVFSLPVTGLLLGRALAAVNIDSTSGMKDSDLLSSPACNNKTKCAYKVAIIAQPLAITKIKILPDRQD